MSAPKSWEEFAQSCWNCGDTSHIQALRIAKHEIRAEAFEEAAKAYARLLSETPPLHTPSLLQFVQALSAFGAKPKAGAL
jgi:hypothetical protein